MLTFCKQIICFVIAETFYMCMVVFEMCMVIFKKCQLLVAELRDTHLYHGWSLSLSMARLVRNLEQ